MGRDLEMKAVHNTSVLVMRSYVQRTTWGSEFLMMLRQVRGTLTWPGPGWQRGKGSCFATNLSQALLPPSLPSFSQLCLPSFPVFIQSAGSLVLCEVQVLPHTCGEQHSHSCPPRSSLAGKGSVTQQSHK